MRSATLAGLLAGIAGAAVLAAPPASADDCPDGYLARCAQNGTAPAAGPARPAGEVPRVQGIPCTGSHLGVCIAQSQARGDAFPGLTTGPALGPGATPGRP
jgi:hypothetical protein